MNSIHNIDRYWRDEERGDGLSCIISAKRVVHWLNIEIFSALFTLHKFKIVNLLYTHKSCVPLFS